MRKFKIGDVIMGRGGFSYTIIDIIYSVTDYVGNWIDRSKVRTTTNCYVLLDINSNYLYDLSFSFENNYVLVSQPETITLPGYIAKNISCPQCNGELAEKYSEWAGKNINKCKSCGWC